jgi:hypothetical protein
VPVLVVSYVIAIAAIIAVGGNAWEVTTEVPIIGVPISVLMWAAIGSVAAILYRFYTRERGRVSREIRWLIARPVFGIIMGALSYLAVLSGLFIFGTAAGADPAAIGARPHLMWMLAFLGGFSDRIFDTIIHGVVNRISGPEDSRPAAETVDEEA